MPLNTLRLASPISRVRRSSLSAPSTNSHFSIRAIRRSTAAKASKAISAASGSLVSSPLPAAAGAASLAARASFGASVKATDLGGQRVFSQLAIARCGRCGFAGGQVFFGGFDHGVDFRRLDTGQQGAERIQLVVCQQRLVIVPGQRRDI